MNGEDGKSNDVTHRKGAEEHKVILRACSIIFDEQEGAHCFSAVIVVFSVLLSLILLLLSLLYY